jgi:phosphoglycolate phosphatase
LLQPKPDPAGLLLALQRFNLPATDVLYVGDHPVDAEAASRVGVPFMAVLTGTSEVPSFAPYPVHSFLANVSHLPSQLQMFGSMSVPAAGSPL